jgi:benzoyl-CoA reductase/2-hydroxyglutaryl-CoA dehydratase subunit BcrC/BadD/HgdB
LKDILPPGKDHRLLPYYVPEELVHAAGMVPFGIWGSNDLPIGAAKEYFLPFIAPLRSSIWKWD